MRGEEVQISYMTDTGRSKVATTEQLVGLVAEHDPAQADLLRYALRPWGYHVLLDAFSDGQALWAAVFVARTKDMPLQEDVSSRVLVRLSPGQIMGLDEYDRDTREVVPVGQVPDA